MASETIDPIDYSDPSPYTGQHPRAPHIAQGNVSCKSQDLLHSVRRERATFGMPFQRSACAANHGRLSIGCNLTLISLWSVRSWTRCEELWRFLYVNYREIHYWQFITTLCVHDRMNFKQLWICQYFLIVDVHIHSTVLYFFIPQGVVDEL